MKDKRICIDKLSTQYSVRKIGAEDLNDVYKIGEGNPMYYEHYKAPLTREMVIEDLSEVPPGKTQENKYFLGFYDGEIPVAVMDLIDGFPDDETAYIGFFMMNKSMQGRGIGSLIISDVMKHLRDAGFMNVRLGYIKTNEQSKNFWLKNGFVPTGDEKDFVHANGCCTAVVAQREL